MGSISVIFGSAISVITFFFLIYYLPKENISDTNTFFILVISTITGLIAEIIKIKLYKYMK